MTVAGHGILLQQFGDGGLEGIELAGALSGSGGLRRCIEVLGQRSAADVQMTRDLAQRPLLEPVQAMNFVDLIGGEHGSDFGYTANRAHKPEGCSFQDAWDPASG